MGCGRCYDDPLQYVVPPSRALADGCRKTSSYSLENTQHDCAHKGENNIRGDYAQLADEGTCEVHSDVSQSLGRFRSLSARADQHSRQRLSEKVSVAVHRGTRGAVEDIIVTVNMTESPSERTRIQARTSFSSLTFACA